MTSLIDASSSSSSPCSAQLNQTNTLDSDAELDGGRCRSSWPVTCAFTDASASQCHQLATLAMPILPAPLHLATTLIEYWFRCVCPMRSTFDSDINYNRQLASSTWSISEAVFHTMQLMSAACLVDSMPQLKETLPSMRDQAAAAIYRGLSQIRTSELSAVTADLVFAVFALGTSLHWITPVPLEDSWLHLACELLFTWKSTLSAADSLLYAYFSQALTYWEMLLTMVGRGPLPDKIKKMVLHSQRRLNQTLQLPHGVSNAVVSEPQSHHSGHSTLGTRPNSWCGVSMEVIDVFGQVLALCRSACVDPKKQDSTTVATASNVLCAMSLAHEFQKELLAMDFRILVLLEEAQGYPVQTQDEKTPIAHLIQTAEAYRQAALLQLHLTFSDLPITTQGKRDEGFQMDLRPDDSINGTRSTSQSHSVHLLALTLQLVSTLEQIPVGSGSGSIHPILYLSAAAGLKNNTCSNSGYVAPTATEPEAVSSPPTMEHSTSTTDHLSSGVTDSADHYASNLGHAADIDFLQSALDVSRARLFVWKRLRTLQQMLPHRASENTLRLVQAVWQKYDQSAHNKVHWIDVMEETGLETISS